MTQFLKVYPINGPNQTFVCSTYSKPEFEFLFQVENPNVVLNCRKSKLFVDLYLEFADDTNLWNRTGEGFENMFDGVTTLVSSKVLLQTKCQRKQYIVGLSPTEDLCSNNVNKNAALNTLLSNTSKVLSSDWNFFQEFMWTGTHSLFEEMSLQDILNSVEIEKLREYNLLAHTLLLQSTELELKELNRKYGFNPLLFIRGIPEIHPKLQDTQQVAVVSNSTDTLSPFKDFIPAIFDHYYDGTTTKYHNNTLIGNIITKYDSSQIPFYYGDEKFVLGHIKPLDSEKHIFFDDLENSSTNTYLKTSITVASTNNVNAIEDNTHEHFLNIWDKYRFSSNYKILSASKQSPARFQVPLLFQKFRKQYSKMVMTKCVIKTSKFYDMFTVRGMGSPAYPSTLNIFNPYFELCLEMLPEKVEKQLSLMKFEIEKSIETFDSRFYEKIPSGTYNFNIKIQESPLTQIDRILITFVKNNNVNNSTRNIFEFQTGASQGWINPNEMKTYLSSYQFFYQNVAIPQIPINCGPKSRIESINHVYDVLYNGDVPDLPLINESTYDGICANTLRGRYETVDNFNSINIGYQNINTFISGTEYMFMIGYNFGQTTIDLNLDILTVNLNFLGGTPFDLRPFVILFGTKNV